MDTTLVQIFSKTCAISFTEGWVCGMQNLEVYGADEIETTVGASSGSPFTSYILISFGYLVPSTMECSYTLDCRRTRFAAGCSTTRTEYHRSTRFRHRTNLRLHHLDIHVLPPRSRQ